MCCTKLDDRHCLQLIHALLLTGCVEMNPGPPNLQNMLRRTSSTYEKIKGHADMSGELFEIKVASLLFLRGLRFTKSFYLASNMSEAGVFDDIVFLYRDQNDSCNIWFLQLKHKKTEGKRSTVSLKDLLAIKGDFSLPKYCNSYNMLKQQFVNNKQHLIFRENFDCCLFAIYTNATNYKFLPVRSEFGTKSILNSDGNVFSFSEYKTETVSKYFEDLPRYREFLNELRNNMNSSDDFGEKISDFSKDLCSELRAQLLRIKNKVTRDELDKMINDVDSLGNFSDHQEFFSRLYMFTSQKSEKDLNQVIRSEIKEIFCTTTEDDDDTTAIFRQVFEYIQLWWKYDNYYLSESVPFWQDVVQTRLDQMNDLKTQQLRKSGIKFNDFIVGKIQTAIVSNNFLNIVCDGEAAFLTLTKTYQALEQSNLQYLLVDIDILNVRKKEIFCLWPHRCKVLVIYFENNLQNTDKTRLDQIWESIISIFKPERDQKIIFISNSSDVTSHLLLNDKIKYKLAEINDKFNFEDLNKESQSLLFKKTTVDFQGVQIRLETLLKKCPMLAESINGKTALRLLNGSYNIMVGEGLDCEIDYYIPRLIESHQTINTSILSEQSLDHPCVIAISGFTLKEIFKCVPRGTKIKKTKTRYSRQSSEVQSQYSSSGNIDTVQEEEVNSTDNKNCAAGLSSSENCHNSTCLYIIESKEEYDLLCGKYPNVHWLTKCEQNGTEALNWVKSQGETDIIYQHLNTATATNYRVDNIFSLNNQVVLVIAEAGMGKSTLFTHLAIRTKETNPDIWVLKVNLNDHTNFLEKIDPQQCNEQNLMSFLCLAARVKTSFESKLLEHCVKEEGNIAVLLDGYDEISPTHATKAAAIIQCLLKTRVKKVWISSRPIMKNFLQKLLSTFPYHLKPFTETEQEMFILNFWRSKLKNISFNVEMFAKKLLALSSKFLDSQFMGIPLQTMMLAVAYENQISKFYDAVLPESIDLLQLYDQFVEKKVSIYCKDKKKIDTSKASFQEDNEYWHNVFVENHILASMMTLFPASQYHDLYTQDAIIKTKKIISKIEAGHEKTGIINNVVDNKPQFVHRTFADYFVGKCLCILYQSNVDDSVYQTIRKYFVSNLSSGIALVYKTIFNQDFTVARNIFDKTLAHDLPLHSALINKDQSLVVKLISEGNDVNVKDIGGRTPLHLAACYCISDTTETSNVLKELLHRGADVNAVDNVLKWTPLRYADKIKAWSNIEMILNGNGTTDDLIETRIQASKGRERQGILHVAVSQGFMKLLEFIMQTKYVGEINHKQYLEYERYTLLRTAVKNEQWEALKCLVEKHININARYGEGETVTHWAARQGKPEAVSQLVKLGADINARNSYGNTPLHTAAKNGSLSVVSQILVLGADVSITNNDGYSPLYVAADHSMWHVVNYLLYSGSKIQIASIGNSPLHWAAEKGELDIIQQMAQLNVSLDITNSEGNTPLHWAVRKGSIETINLLVHLKANINIRNNLGETPIAYAAKQSLWDKVDALLNLGADANISNNIGNVPLHWAAKHGTCNIVSKLAEQSHIDIRDNFGNTPLHFAAGSGKCDIIEKLVELKAPVNVKNSSGSTPLHWAAGENKVNAVKLLATLGAGLEIKNNSQDTALHLAAGQSRKESDARFHQINMVIDNTRSRYNRVYRFYAYDSLEMVQLLVGLGSRAKRRNKKGNLPLHLACLQGNIKIVKYLSECTFGINTKNNLGMTPLDLALRNKNSKTRTKVVALLKAQNASRGNIIARFLPI